MLAAGIVTDDLGKERSAQEFYRFLVSVDGRARGTLGANTNDMQPLPDPEEGRTYLRSHRVK